MNTKSNQDTMTHQSDTQNDSLIGQRVASFFSNATDNFDIDFEKLEGYQIVLFFYPQNGQPGVTQLAKDFATHYPAFKQIKTCIFGVSGESLDENQIFKDHLHLPFQLIADLEAELGQWFNVMTERTLFGESVNSLEQATFLIDAQSKVAKIWRSPEIRGHALAVLEAAHKLSEGLNESFDTTSISPLASSDGVSDTPHATDSTIENDEAVIPASSDQEKLKEDLAAVFEQS